MNGPLPGVIEPRWWTGTPALPPMSFMIDCREYAMGEADLAPDGELARRMNETFDEIGLVYLVNTGLTDDPDEAEAEARELGVMIGEAYERVEDLPDKWQVQFTICDWSRTGVIVPRKRSARPPWSLAVECP